MTHFNTSQWPSPTEWSHVSTSSNLYCFDGFENQNCSFEYKSVWMRLFLEDADTSNHRNRRQQDKFQSLIDSKSSSLINRLSQVAFESSQNYCTLFCVVRANQHWIYFEKDIWSVLLETIGNIGYSHAAAWKRQQFWGCEKHYVALSPNSRDCMTTTRKPM